jgi:hypothetical protein
MLYKSYGSVSASKGLESEEHASADGCSSDGQPLCRSILRIPRGRARGTWGGARNRSDRQTSVIRQHQAEGMLRAMALAELRGMPLNRHWTVDYELAGIADKNGAAFIGRLLSACRRYARSKDVAFAAVWVREIGERNGAHVHIAMHFPAEMRLGHLTCKWIKAAGGEYAKGISHVRSIGGGLKSGDSGSPHYRANLEMLANYHLKGSAPDVARELGLTKLKAGGSIIGKRCGWTQNLGEKVG